MRKNEKFLGEISVKVLNVRKRIWLLGLVEVVLFLIYAVYCIADFQRIQLIFSQEEMQLQRQETEDIQGSYLDVSFSDAKGVVTPEFILPEGIYYISVDYEAHGPAVGGLIYELPREGKELVNENEFRMKGGAEKFAYRVKIKDGEGIRFRLRLTGDASDGDYVNLYQVSVTGSRLSCAYRIFLFFACMAAVDAVLIWKRKYQKSQIEDKIIMIALPLAAFGLGMPLYQDGIVNGIDLPFHLSRIEGIYEGLKMGQFPVRIQPGWIEDYGYAASIFYGDVLLYFPALLRMVGFTLQDAYKVFLLAIHVATLLTAYYSFRTCFQDKVISLTGAVLFAGSSERLFRIYEASQAGAFSAMIFYPVVFTGLYLLLDGTAAKKKRYAWMWLVAGFTGLLLTHMLSGLIVGIFAVLSCMLRPRIFFRKDTLLQVGKAFGIWLLLNLWFIVPLLQYMGGNFQITSSLLTDSSAVNYHAQLANYQNSSGTLADIFLGTKESLGYPLVFVLILFLMTLPLRKKGKWEKQSYMILGLAVVGGILCMNLIPSVRLAELNPLFLKLFRTIQYGIRFLTIVTFLVCVLGCCFLLTLPLDRKRMCLVAAGLCALALYQDLGILGALSPDAMIMESVDLGDNILGNGEYIPVGTDLNDMSKDIRYDSSALRVDSVQRNYLSFSATVENYSKTEQTLSFPVLFYEGYRTKDMATGTTLETMVGENNGVSVKIPAGYAGSICMEFDGFWYWRASEVISGLTVAVGICAIVWYNRREKRKKEPSAESAE